MEYYCPYCIEKLEKNRKKLGSKLLWLVCPKCGYRVRENAIIFSEKKELEEFEKMKAKINENNHDE